MVRIPQNGNQNLDGCPGPVGFAWACPPRSARDRKTRLSFGRVLPNVGGFFLGEDFGDAQASPGQFAGVLVVDERQAIFVDLAQEDLPGPPDGFLGICRGPGFLGLCSVSAPRATVIPATRCQIRRFRRGLFHFVGGKRLVGGVGMGWNCSGACLFPGIRRNGWRVVFGFWLSLCRFPGLPRFPRGCFLGDGCHFSGFRFFPGGSIGRGRGGFPGGFFFWGGVFLLGFSGLFAGPTPFGGGLASGFSGRLACRRLLWFGGTGWLRFSGSGVFWHGFERFRFLSGISRRGRDQRAARKLPESPRKKTANHRIGGSNKLLSDNNPLPYFGAAMGWMQGEIYGG